MRRRDLLMLFGAMGVAASPLSVLSAAPLHRRLPVLGLERYQGKALLPAFGRGDPLRLAPAPQDESTPHRIVVFWGDFLIGYLPDAECQDLHVCLSRDELNARIAELDEKVPGLWVEIWRR